MKHWGEGRVQQCWRSLEWLQNRKEVGVGRSHLEVDGGHPLTVTKEDNDFESGNKKLKVENNENGVMGL